MKAMVLRGPNEPFVLEDRPDPTPGPGEAVARVLACGSGLTIQHVRAGRTGANFPIVIGHEITGEIVAVGPRTETLPVIEPLRDGDPVTCWFYLIEGEDRWTRSDRPTISTKIQGHVGRQIDGGYAEYIKLPVQNFIKLPEALDWRGHPAEAGVICDAIATPYKVLRRGRVGPRDTVAVFGAGGGVGLHQVMMCKWAHARVIAVEVAAHKFAACRDAGADAVVDAGAENVVDAIHELTRGRGRGCGDRLRLVHPDAGTRAWRRSGSAAVWSRSAVPPANRLPSAPRSCSERSSNCSAAGIAPARKSSIHWNWWRAATFARSSPRPIRSKKRSTCINVWNKAW